MASVTYDVSEACQINDLDHDAGNPLGRGTVSEACQINALDHAACVAAWFRVVSEACQINDLDHLGYGVQRYCESFRSLSDQ